MSNLPAKTDVRAISSTTAPDGTITAKFSDGTVLTADSRYFGLRGDSGQVTAFRPAVYQKPEGFTSRIQRAWSGFLGQINPSSTTEQGASSAASPVTFYLTLWAQLFGRRTIIEDTRSLYLADPRVFRSTNMYVDIALKGGPKIRVQGKDRRAKQAALIAKEVGKVYNAALCQEWGKGLVIEGDLFVQHIVEPNTSKLIGAAAMPGVGMQRLVNDADQFINPDEAFEQIDSMTFGHVAFFPSSLMNHVRWSKVNGDQYGTSELCTARRMIRAQEIMEQALTVSRMVRAPLRRLHNIGTADNTGSLQEINNYKAQNGFFTGKNDAYNPQSVMIDYYANGNVTIDTLLGDPHQAQVDDIKYLASVLMCALPTPGVFFGFGIEDAKRDIIEDMKRLWILSHKKLQEAIDEPVRHGFELQLTLAGIDPALIEYSVQWSGGSLETPAETVAWLSEAKTNNGISQKTYVQKIAELIGTTDIEEEMAAIEKENAEAQAQQMESQEALAALKIPPAQSKNGAKPSTASKN